MKLLIEISIKYIYIKYEHFTTFLGNKSETWYRPLHLTEIDLSAMPGVDGISVQITSSSLQSCDSLQLPAENANQESLSNQNETSRTTVSSVNNLIKML